MAADARLTRLRVLLATLAVVALTVGIPATLAPLWFYEHFPWARSWLPLTPPYSEHLMTDVGGLQLAGGLLLAWAAYRPSRELVLPLCAAWFVNQALHFVWHATHLERFSTGDAIAQTIGLAYLVLVPLAVLRLMAARPSAS